MFVTRISLLPAAAVKATTRRAKAAPDGNATTKATKRAANGATES